MIRVVVVGMGAMGKGICQVLNRMADIEIVAVADIDMEMLISSQSYIGEHTLTTNDSYMTLGCEPDILIDASTAITDAVLLAEEAFKKGIHVIFMNSEADQLFGRLLAREAKKAGVIFTSDAGDQYGVLARLIEEVRLMGLQIVMAGNNKGFLNVHANPANIKAEADKRRLNYRQCTAYTDGTKLAIEMALIANAEDLGILQYGMAGPKADKIEEVLCSFDLENALNENGVVDYVLGAEPGGSVFVIGYTDDSDDRFYLDYYKMGKGPFYLFLRPYHICHFETPLAIRYIMDQHRPVMIQKAYRLEVLTCAKRDLKEGTVLDGIGGYDTRGVLGLPSLGLPIGLSEGVTLLVDKIEGDLIRFDEAEFKLGSSLLKLWNKQEDINVAT